MIKKPDNIRLTKKNDGWGAISGQTVGPNYGWNVGLNSGWDDNISYNRRSAFKNTFISRPPPIHNKPLTSKESIKSKETNTCNIL